MKLRNFKSYNKFIISCLKNNLRFGDLCRSIRRINKSDYSFSIRLSFIKTYILTWCKSIFFLGRKEKYYIRLLDYKVSTFNYKMFLFIFEEIFVEQDYGFKTDTDSPIIIDGGANLGLATLYFKWKYPKSSVICFEPDPNIFELLCDNIAQNHLNSVTTINAAICDFKGEISFYSSYSRYSWNSGVGSIFQERINSDKKIQVASVLLSEYITCRIDLLKLDIEGAEQSVVEELIKADKMKLINEFKIEYHHRVGGNKSQLSLFLKRFEDHDFEYQLRSSFAQPNVTQDILIHFYRN